MKKSILYTLVGSLFLIGSISCGGGSAEKSNAEDHANHEEMDHSKSSEGELLPIPPQASVSFGKIEQKGTKIDSTTGEELFTYRIEFQVQGMEVEPAGELNEGRGHHHLIINGGPIPRGEVVPADSVNIHFGAGQTETEIDLPRGEYQLTMQFADGYHQSYGEQLAADTQLSIQ